MLEKITGLITKPKNKKKSKKIEKAIDKFCNGKGLSQKHKKMVS